MYNKKLTLIFLVLLSTTNITCNKEICEPADFLADLVIDSFSVIIGGNNPIVNAATGTVMTIKNFIYERCCEEDGNSQYEAEESYADYQVFFRESASDDWEAVETSEQMLVGKIVPGSTEAINQEVIFTQEGEYYLRARADIGNDVEEADEDNNDKENDNGTLDTRSSNIRFIRVDADDNTDCELMRKRKEQGIYVIFK